jgi:mannose-6-phosphate isomerase
MPYAWGSRTLIATLQGRTVPSPGPEAEVWMGAHPRGPSRLVRDGVETTLDQVISANGVRELGADVTAAFDSRLPFLLKVLAAAEPLSLQAHPSAAQASLGFAREEQLGIPLDAPHRNYKDTSHKPELLCALTPFDALCGFRRVDDTLALFDALGVSEADAVLAPLRWSDRQAGLSATLHAIMTRAQPASTELVDAVVAACAAHDGPFSAECRWAMRLARLYPGDPGVVTALLLNLVHLEPGEAIYLDAGNLHAYLGGMGVEIMASSDNVLRGGLTTKHVDLEQLLTVLRFVDGPVAALRPRSIGDQEEVWDTPAREFRLSRLHLVDQQIARHVNGPEILLCVDGAIDVSSGRSALQTGLQRGTAAFIAADSDAYTLNGVGTVFRATVGSTSADVSPR